MYIFDVGDKKHVNRWKIKNNITCGEYIKTIKKEIRNIFKSIWVQFYHE